MILGYYIALTIQPVFPSSMRSRKGTRRHRSPGPNGAIQPRRLRLDRGVEDEPGEKVRRRRCPFSNANSATQVRNV
jgi:hypothetical protein